MKYNAPYGSADPNAPYIDRNTPGAQSGSRVPAAAVEHPQREIMAVISAAGIPGSTEDLTQLLQAIQALIAAATGGGDTSNFVLMTAARARLPIFPEVLTEDGRIPVITPSTGQVRVPAGYNFLHRGIFNITTVQTDFATTASKTYHLRWTPGAGFAMKDLADTGYNPGGALAETDISFDSAYDDMLVAKVVTTGGNVVTVTNLSNKNRLFDSFRASGGPSLITGDNGWQFNYTRIINWARRPAVFSLDGAMTAVTVNSTGYLQGTSGYSTKDDLSRYQAAAHTNTDWNSAAVMSGMTAYLDFNLAA
jgi:hypothetical protein